jgi:hypothetical protein
MRYLFVYAIIVYNILNLLFEAGSKIKNFFPSSLLLNEIKKRDKYGLLNRSIEAWNSYDFPIFLPSPHFPLPSLQPNTVTAPLQPLKWASISYLP